MKLTALFGAAALAATSLTTASPAEAQRYGYGDARGYGYGNGYRGGYRGDRWRGGQRFDRGDRWRGRNQGWRGGRNRGYSRVVCRVRDGYYGPVRRCFRVYR
jgi:hypothetical protein